MDERQYLEELKRRMDEVRQSAKASAREAAEQEKGSYYDLDNNSRRIEMPLLMRENNNDGIGKNVEGCCSTTK